MIIRVKVIPNARKSEIFREEEIIKVKVSSPAIDGRANKEVIEILANFLKLRKDA